ncbi:MAG: glucokinase [Myxococcales bacterium]|nr:glucokinase [Myxococcales bacterium]
MRVLVGDVGGTRARLAVYRIEGGALALERRQTLPSQDFPSLGAACAELRVTPEPLDGACFALAGPVRGDRCRTTNLPWQVDATELRAELGLPIVRLLNDFEAAARGIAALPPSSLETLQAGAIDPRGARLLIGAGTGLGKAVIVPMERGERILASEGGHSAFAPRDALERELQAFLEQRHGRVSVERVVSGLGLRAIYEFLVERGYERSDPALATRISSGDAGALIAAHAEDDPACGRALALFLGAYGAAAGDFALEVLPLGGLFLGGGIAIKLRERLREGAFLEGLRAKGRMRPLLERIQVQLILDDDLGLLGAARYLASELRGEPAGP